MMDYDLRLGDWNEVLSDIEEVDAIICDPPYSARTHEGHDDGANLANRVGKGWERSDGGIDVFRPRRALSYSAWSEADVNKFVESWAPRCRGWFVAMSDSELIREWRTAFERAGLTTFAPVSVMIKGMTVRMNGDGPSSWTLYLNVARPKALSKWGTLPGGYHGGQGEREHIGGKPLWLMQSIVRDYTRVGDTVCDPCAGGGTTMLAALREGRNAIGAEVDPETHAVASARIKKSYTPDLFSTTTAKRRCTGCGLTLRLGAFAADRSRVSGQPKQSQCRRCKALWEQSPENSWKRMRADLEPKEPDSFRAPYGWTKELYLRMWKECDGLCTLCGSRLNEWQISGHRLDRIDNSVPHIPANCRLLCWPCNSSKSSRNPHVADAEIERQVAKWGRGKVPWQTLGKPGEFERRNPPSVDEHVVADEPSQLDIFARAAK